MKIVVYTLCFNEEVILPYFLKHYGSFCDKIIIYDHYSTDNSRNIIKDCPIAELRTYDTGGILKNQVMLDIKNNVWKENRDYADYVIVCDMDEFLYHKQGTKQFIEQKFNAGVSLFKPQGYNIYDNHLPYPDKNIFEQYPNAFIFSPMSKCVIFNPKKLKEINFTIGAHTCEPLYFLSKDINYYIAKEKDDLMLLHFKQLSYEYWQKRNKICLDSASENDLKHGWGIHNLDAMKVTEEQYIQTLKTITKY